MANMLTMPPSKAVAALTPKESGTSPLPPAAPKPAANALATNAMGNTAMTPQKSPYAAAAAPKPQSLVNGAIDGFMRGFRPEQWQADQDKTKLDGAERAKKTLALMQQQRQIPAEQRAQWWQQNADQIGQIVGADVKSLPMDANSFSDQALDGQIAMMSAKLGIAPEKPEPMSAYEAAQIKQKEDEAARLAGAPIKMGEDTLLDPKTYQPLYQAAPKPEKPPSWQTQTIGNRVIAYNPQDPKQTMDMGPAPVTGAGERGGLTDYQGLQFQFKLDDLDRDIAAERQKDQTGVTSINNTIALLDQYTDQSTPENEARFNDVYGNFNNPTGKGDDFLNWKVPAGSPRANGMAMLDQLGGQTFLASITAMRGSGALSDAEGARLTNAATRLMIPTLSDDEARKAATEFRAALVESKAAIERYMAQKATAQQQNRSRMQAMMGSVGGGQPQSAPTAADASDDDILSALGLK